jgi:hypothetical protein
VWAGSPTTVVYAAYGGVMERPSVRVSIANFRDYDAPFATKLKLVLANNLTKLRNHSGCCGNHGQPGC